MQPEQLLQELFGFANTLYGVAKPIIILQLLAFLLIPQILQSRNPKEVGHAIFCYLMEGLGLLLMSVGSIPTFIAAFSPSGLHPEVYLGLLLVFATGGILFLWHDQQIREMDAEVKAIPAAIYFYTIKTVGYLCVVFAALGIALSITLGAVSTAGWWTAPIVVLLYGCILCWFTSLEPYGLAWLIDSEPEKPAKKPAAKKPAKKKKK